MPSFPLSQSVGGIGFGWRIAPASPTFGVGENLLDALVGPRPREPLRSYGLEEGPFSIATMKFEVAVPA